MQKDTCSKPASDSKSNAGNIFESINAQGQYDIFQDASYQKASARVIGSALKNHKDVVQMPNGDIIATETIIRTKVYKWDPYQSEMRDTILEEVE